MVFHISHPALFLACALSTQAAPRLGAGEDHLLFLRDDGTLWALGDGAYGQLGGGGSGNRPQALPVRVDSARWSKVSAGSFYSLAIREDGSLWAFGRNSSAQSGLGTRTDVPKPERVGSQRWLDVAGGVTATLAIRQDSSLRIWGGWGKESARTGLGSGDGQSRQPAGGKWRAVAMGADHGLALRGDGTLWALGDNSAGQTGCGASPAHAVPCQAGTSLWTAVAAGENFSAGIRADGTLWTWGGNTLGESGRGTSSPSEGMGQVGGEHWLAVSAGGHHVLALRADSTLWAWGSGGSGALGDGRRENRLAPVQVGSGKWRAVAAGRRFSAGLRGDGNFMIWGDLGFAPAGGPTIAERPTFVDRQLALAPLAPAIYGGGAVALNVEYYRGDEIAFSSSDAAVAAVSGASLSIKGAGRTEVAARATPRAGQAAGEPLAAAQTLEVAKAPQSLTFAQPPDLTVGAAGVRLEARSSAGLPPVFQSSDGKVASVAGDLLQAEAPGRITVTALQPGDANHLPAPPVTRTLLVLPAAVVETRAAVSKAWLIAGGGAVVAGGVIWAVLALTGEEDKEDDLGVPPGDPALGVVR